jgi:hypothetical protein
MKYTIKNESFPLADKRKGQSEFAIRRKTGTTMAKAQRLVPQWIKHKDWHHNG